MCVYIVCIYTIKKKHIYIYDIYIIYVYIFNITHCSLMVLFSPACYVPFRDDDDHCES